MTFIKPLIYRLGPPEYVMHKSPCKHCPSMIGTDPEVEDIKQRSHEEIVETAFTCGWRPDKFCKGYCDVMGITNEDLMKLKESHL